MKYIVSMIALAALCTCFGFTQPRPTKQPNTLTWYTWEQAVELQKTKPKKVMVDMYTDWCGWCKHMDATTFQDSAVVAYLQENFYPVKFNAEQKTDLLFRDYNFKYIAPQGGSRGVHELAFSLLEGKLGYPSLVYLTPTYERILISPGYKDVTGMMKELIFVRDDIYTTKSFEDYKAGK
jgi:uncharacterized protein YyaL (SSP411 family)